MAKDICVKERNHVPKSSGSSPRGPQGFAFCRFFSWGYWGTNLGYPSISEADEHQSPWMKIAKDYKVYSYPKKACNGLPTIMVQRCNTLQGDWKWLSSFMISGQPIPFRPTQKHSKWIPTWACLRVENPANSHFSILLDELLYFPNFFSLKKRAHPGQKAHCDNLQLGEPAPLRLTYAN